MINPHQLWLDAPARAFRDWQENEATGTTRRAFSARSIIQHTAMFERFLRHLVHANVSVATFGEDHLDTFLGELEMRCASRTSTPPRSGTPGCLTGFAAIHRNSLIAGRISVDTAHSEPAALSADIRAALD